MGGLAKCLMEDQELVRVVEEVCEQVWNVSPPENWNEIYGDAFEWTPQEKMLMQQLRRRTHDL